MDLPINNGTITWPQAGQLLETDAAEDSDAEFHHEELPMLFPTGAPEARWAWSPWSPAVVTSSTIDIHELPEIMKLGVGRLERHP